MKKLLFTILTTFYIVNIANAQNPSFTWAKQMGKTGKTCGNSIAIDASGNTYTAGIFDSTADFDPGIGVFNMTAAGFDDIFITKIDATGNFIWAKQFKGTRQEYVYSITVDALGNVYTTGHFGGYQAVTDFDPGNGVFNLTVNGGNSYDVFISKLDSSGNFVWVKQLGGSNFDYSNSLIVDNSGNVYTTGNFSGTADFDPGNVIFNMSAIGTDAFISKLDPNGNFIWAKQFGSSNNNSAITRSLSIDLDAFGNVYSSGYFNNTIDFDPGPGTFNMSCIGNNNAYVSKLNSAGNFIWAKQFCTGVGIYSYSNTMKVDSLGNVLVTGTFSNGTADFDPGNGIFNMTSDGSIYNLYRDIFISKLDNLGNFVWAKKLGGNQDDVVTSIDLDVLGNIYTTGVFFDSADFDPGNNTFNLISNGYADMFISKLNSSGNFVWAKQIGGSGNAIGSGSSMLVDKYGSIYSTGNFRDTVDFDPENSMFNMSSFSNNSDAFILKLNSNISTTISESSFDKNFIIYPNPNAGVFTIKTEQEGTYSIINELGQTIQQFQLNNANNYTVNITNLSTGIYFIVGYNNDQIMREKIIVTK